MAEMKYSGHRPDIIYIERHCPHFWSYQIVHQGRYSQRQSLRSMIPDLIKDDSFVLISSLSGPNYLDKETFSLIGCYGGQAYDSS